MNKIIENFRNIAEATEEKTPGKEKITKDEIDTLKLDSHRNKILSYFNLADYLELDTISEQAAEKAMKFLMFIQDVSFKSDTPLRSSKTEKPNIVANEIVAFLYSESHPKINTLKELKEKIFSKFTEIQRTEFVIFFDHKEPITMADDTLGYTRKNFEKDTKGKLANYERYKELISKINKYKNTAIKSPKIELFQHEKNRGKEKSLPKEYAEVIRFNKLQSIADGTIEKTKKNDDIVFKRFKELEESKTHSVAEINHFFNIFGKAILNLYKRRDSAELQCVQINAVAVLLSNKMGIDMHFCGTDYHSFGVIKIKNDDDIDMEYRIDFTANQFTKDFAGCAVVPRIEFEHEGFSWYGENIDKLKIYVLSKEGLEGLLLFEEEIHPLYCHYDVCGEDVLEVLGEAISDLPAK